ncbi:MAG: OmpA family protein [Chitinophagaceae bacterium]|nr:OmpA family protein [Chitinophagaceae bacterium]
MKKLYFSLFALTLSVLSHSQLRVSLIGGGHSASVTETNSLPGWDTLVKPNYTSRTGIHVGFLAEVPLGASSRWYLQPAVIFMAKGRKYAQSNDTTVAAATDTLTFKSNLLTNYIDIPINLTYKLPLGKKSNFIVSAGPYLGFFFKGKSTTELRAYSNNKYTKEETTLEVGKDVNKAKTVDVGVNARAGFEFGGVMITGFYSQGLTDFYTADYEGSFKHKVIGASLAFWLNKPVEKRPRDKDKDGIVDKDDACPDVAGTLATGGCPDKDNDGVADAVDKCAEISGVARFGGCPVPDTDKDGLNDEEDKCPTIAGTSKYLGCPAPDKDGDGINDEADSCPDKAGTVEFNGCPIPDSDGDGLNDKVDKCPTEMGVADNDGCPAIKKEIVEKVKYAASQVFFAKNSDRIIPSSFTALNQVAEILKADQILQVTITGHTDNAGKPEYNRALSKKRAEAVRAYLIKQGINALRLTSEGYGDEKPVGDNNTDDGKAKNRRVEIELHRD